MIHLSEGRLASVKRERDLNTPAWQRLYRVCYQYQNVPEPYGEGHMIGFALAGLVDHRPDWKSKAVALALSRCEMGYEAISYQRTGYGHYGGVREVVPAVACVYDWLYSWMTDTQRSKIEEWLIRWGSLCWPETQPADMRADYGRNDPGDNFYAGFMYASMAAGLVLTTRAAERPLEVRSMLNAARSRWFSELFTHKAKHEPDGFPLEGSSYGVQAWTNLLLAKDAWESVKGETLWHAAPTLLNQYLLHMTTPDMRRLTLWGDNAILPGGKGVNLMPLNDYVTFPARIAMNHVSVTGSPTSFAWWLNSINPMPPGGWELEAFVDGTASHLMPPASILDHSGYRPDPPEAFAGAFAPPSPFHWLAWVPVLFARPEFQDDGGGRRAPLVSPANGFAIACQSNPKTLSPDFPDTNATQLSFICGPSIQAHQDKAQGAIQIYKDGEMLIGSARLWNSHWEDWRSAQNHSTLLLPPNHQVEPIWNDPDAPAGWKAAAASVKITRSVSAERYLYLEGELAGAYANRGPWHDDPEKRWVNPLKRWTRRILWHRAHDLFLFIDEVETQPWAQQPVIAWQVRDQPRVIGVNWSATIAPYRVVAQTYGDIARTYVQPVGNSYRVMAESSQTGLTRIIHALEITTGSLARSTNLYNRDGALGVTFGSDKDAVTLAVQMGDAPPPVSRRVYTLSDHGPTSRGFESPDWSVFANDLKGRLDANTEGSRQIWDVSARVEGGTQKPEGEFILIKTADGSG